MRTLLVLLASLSLLACGGKTTDATDTTDAGGSGGSSGASNPGGSAGSTSPGGSSGSAGSIATVACANGSVLNGSPCATEGEECGHCSAPSGPLYKCQKGRWNSVYAGGCDDHMPGSGGMSPGSCGDSDSCTGTTTCGNPCTKFYDEGFCGGFSMSGVCDGHGTCQSFPAPACATKPCDGKACGDACAIDGQKGTCSDLGACDLSGAPASCHDYDPCAGKGCGDECDFCPPNADCSGPLGTCSSQGTCMTKLPAGCFDCEDDFDCITGAPSKVCTDGSTVSPSGTCSQNKCVYGPYDCGPPQCHARDAKGTAGCTDSLGWYWKGATCEQVVGCVCEGNDCGTGFSSFEDCFKVFKVCGLD